MPIPIEKAIHPVRRWRHGLADAAGPMGLADLARYAAGLAQSLMDLSEAVSLSEGTAVSCRKGCGACCRQVVPLSPPEVFFLEETLAGMPAEERARGSRRFAEIRDTLGREGMLEWPLFHHAQAYFRLGEACPFLVEEACSIHARRPLACREHLVVTSPDHCADFPSPFSRMLPIAVSVREVVAEISARLTRRAVQMIPLARALEWSDANRELAEGRWESAYLLDLLAEGCLEKLGR